MRKSSLKTKQTKTRPHLSLRDYGEAKPACVKNYGEAKEENVMGVVRVALCQMNPTLGDLGGNIEKMKRMAEDAERSGAQLIVFPELAVSGYPPQDILKYDGILGQMEKAEEAFIRSLRQRRTQAVVIWGNVRRGVGLRNSAKIFPDNESGGFARLSAEYQDKRQLPNYGVFDEARYFRKGDDEPSKLFVSDSGDLKFGVTICEDIWYQQNHLPDFVLNGAKLIVNINASPFHAGKPKDREEMIRARARDNQAFIVYCNMVGGQDGIAFDGGSMVIGPSGDVIARAHLFEEETVFADLNFNEADRLRLDDVRLNSLERPGVKLVPFGFYNKNKSLRASLGTIALWPRDIAQIYQALVLMTRDYVRKNGFSGAVIGLSGGIDSALVAAIASDALGPENVHCLLMPSKYSSKGSIDDSKRLARNFKASFEVIPIQDVVDALEREIAASSMGNVEGSVTEENLQARVRANILMAYANSHPGVILLSTGNKSEVSVGYCTLYGDMTGGFNPLLDVYKTMVYRLSNYRNSLTGLFGSDAIPKEIMTKPPSAELAKDQKDTDSLPPYEKLDPLLKMHIEDCMTSDEIIQSGFCEKHGMEEDEVRRVIKMVQNSEHKRQQAVLGSKISPIAFGIGRRMPNVNRFKL